MRTKHSVGARAQRTRETYVRPGSNHCNGIRYSLFYLEREREGRRELQLWQPWVVERERWKGKRSDLWERAKGSCCFYLPRLTTLTTRYMYVIYPQDCHFSFKCFRSYEVSSSYPNHSLLLCISSVEEVPP